MDNGAVRAIKSSGKSLLPIGVTEIQGEFEDGSAVSIMGPEGTALAVGLTNYSSDELRKIIGRQTPEIDWILGYRRNDEAVHADNLVVL